MKKYQNHKNLSFKKFKVIDLNAEESLIKSLSRMDRII